MMSPKSFAMKTQIKVDDLHKKIKSNLNINIFQATYCSGSLNMNLVNATQFVCLNTQLPM